MRKSIFNTTIQGGSMTEEISASKWVNSIAEEYNVARKGGKKSYGTGNGNKSGTFQKDCVLVADGKQFVVSAGTKYCVFGSMGGSGTAATIYDTEAGNIIIRQNGRVFRDTVVSSHARSRDIPLLPFHG